MLRRQDSDKIYLIIFYCSSSAVIWSVWFPRVIECAGTLAAAMHGAARLVAQGNRALVVTPIVAHKLWPAQLASFVGIAVPHGRSVGSTARGARCQEAAVASDRRNISAWNSASRKHQRPLDQCW